MEELVNILKDIAAINSDNGLKFSPVDFFLHCRRLTNPFFTVSDVEMEHRTILHWEAEGIIEKTNPNEKWRRFSFYDFVWLQIVMELRSFGVPLKTIKKIKLQLFESVVDLAVETLHKSVRDNRDLYLQRFKITSSELDNLPKPEEIIEAYKHADFLTKLNIFIIGSIYSSGPGYLLFDADEFLKPVFIDKIDEGSGINSIMEAIESKSILVVNMSRIIDRFFNGEKFTGERYFEIAVVNRKEREVIDLLREGGIKQVSISLKEGGVFYLEILRKRATKNVVDQIQKIIAKRKYASIKLNLHNGEVFFLEETEKRFIQ